MPRLVKRLRLRATLSAQRIATRGPSSTFTSGCSRKSTCARGWRPRTRGGWRGREFGNPVAFRRRTSLFERDGTGEASDRLTR